MRDFIIEHRANPSDEWKKYKQFDSLYKAQQSFEMLKKHRCNLFKESEYDKYRLRDVVSNIIFY